jgi:hypothetical protein
MSTNDELRELLAAEQAARRGWYESRNTLGQEYRDWSMANRRLSDAALDALPALLARLDSLAGENERLREETSSMKELATLAAAVLERAERAEAELHQTQRLLVAATECRHEELQDLKRAEAENARLREALEACIAVADTPFKRTAACSYDHDRAFDDARACLAAKPKGEL